MGVWDMVQWTSESGTAPHVADPTVLPSSMLRPLFRPSSLVSWQNLSGLLVGRINNREQG